MENLAGLAEIVGPIGVLVVVVAWAIISRRQNGRADRYQVVLTKLDALRDDISEIKSDVRELRGNLGDAHARIDMHLEGH